MAGRNRGQTPKRVKWPEGAVFPPEMDTWAASVSDPAVQTPPYTARVPSWLARRSEADRRLLVLTALLAFAAAAQHWYSIADGIRGEFAHDVSSYLVVANAA